MANTIMTAKNTFAEGLIMDFAPDNTQATCMTSALNATLLTFNGNELSLQNDMGNGRVETAYLPEGYIPVGTCEFGDIIYIVSYNPLTDKSQIGCFPSPERNISSDEISDLGQNLTWKEFQEESLDGTLKRTSVKKVLIDSKKLNPGDKYIIYSDEQGIKGNTDSLSDYGRVGDVINTEHGKLPKYVKLHVVSVEDSGKITYLDTTTKWYNVGDYKYYIHTQKEDSTNPNTPVDIDSYRNLLQSGWSIFSSKVSGKLAILAELETIDTFSCSYILEKIDNYKDNSGIWYKKYKLFLVPEYVSDKNIKLPYICATKSFFNNDKESSVEYYSATKESMILYDDVTNATASSQDGWVVSNNQETIDTGFTFSIPYKESKNNRDYPIHSDSFIYNIEITPAMDYGRLDYLKVLLTIDFNKIGTGDVDFNIWKYHNSSEESAMLTFGINTYPEPGYEVKYITIDFYDNQGHVAQYLLDGKKSYNGIFNEYFALNGKNSNSRISRYKITEENDWTKKPSEWEKEIIKHKGDILEETPEFEDDIFETDTSGEIHQNDAGIIYYGALYAARIQVVQGKQKNFKVLKTEDEINQAKTEITESIKIKDYYRWYWTTPMFNDYYYNTNDFNTLKFELTLDSKTIFSTNPETYIWKTQKINNLGEDFSNNSFYKTYSANVQYIGRDKEPNLYLYVSAGLQNDYGCFNLYDKTLSDIKTEIYLSTGYIKYNLKGDQYVFSGETANITDPLFLYKEEVIKTDGDGQGGKYYLDSPINTTEIKTIEQSIQDDFNITFPTGQGYNLKHEEIEDDLGNKTKCHILTTTLDKCYYQNNNHKQAINLSMCAFIFNKAYTQNIYTSNFNVPVYVPIINDENDLYQIGIGVDIMKTGNVKMYMRGAINLNQHGNIFSITSFEQEDGVFVRPYDADDEVGNYCTQSNVIVDPSVNKDFLEKEWSSVSSLLPEMFLAYPGGHKDTHTYGIIGNTYNGYLDVTKWFQEHQCDDGTKVDNSSSGAKALIQPHDGEGRAYDIVAGGFSQLRSHNTVAFLGMKHKDGFTLFNSAFRDLPDDKSESKQFFSQDSGKSYKNFAYQLYLLLSNTYHKNKRAADQQINLRNYVGNGNCDITFIKNIVTSLSENNPEGTNEILMRGVKFTEYLQAVKDNLPKSSDELNESPNIKLRFISSAINNELQITIKSIPMSFTEETVDAYILKNGALFPSYNLANNTFYIYLNDELQTYQNKKYSFNIKDVVQNLKYLFPNSGVNEFINNDEPKLNGVVPEENKHLTEFQKTYNKFIQEVNEAMQNIDFESSNFGANYWMYDTPIQVRDKKMQILANIMNKLSDYIDGYSKYDFQTYAYNSVPNTNPDYNSDFGWTGAFEVFFNCKSQKVNDNIKYIIELTGYSMKELKSATNSKEYTFDCYLNLNRAFTYDTSLRLISDRGYNRFGIRDDTYNGDSIKESYGGFMRDVIIDKSFQVIP